MPLSTSPILTYVSHIFATLFVGFGINAILRPAHAVSFFYYDMPKAAADAEMVGALSAVYGARDVFMGLALFAAALTGTRQSLGWTLIAASGVVVVDGWVCYIHGEGAGDHWGYAPVVGLVGALMLGILDGSGTRAKTS
jgi:hypothetical protein